MRENSTEATYIRRAYYVRMELEVITNKIRGGSVLAVPTSLIAHTSAPAMSLGISVAVTLVSPSLDPHSAVLLSQSSAPGLILSESMAQVSPE